MGVHGSAENVSTESGAQYHTGTAPGDVANTILLVGDPARADKVASRWDSTELRREYREFVTITGQMDGRRISVTATGIGTDNTEIATLELARCIEGRPTFLRAGSCGGLQPSMDVGDLVVSQGAVRLESTSTAYVRDGYPAVAHPELVMALAEASHGVTGRNVHFGLTATAPGFYGAQGRAVDGLPLRAPNLAEELRACGVLNMEMETSLLLTLASLQGWRAGAVCAVYANRVQNAFADTPTRAEAEAACIDTALAAIRVLWSMDEARGDDARWRPSHGLKT